jgi:fucose permease
MSNRDEETPLLNPSTIGPQPTTPIDPPKTWLSIQPSTFKIAAVLYSFVVLGLFTSSTGVMLPHISSHYSLNDLYVSFIFLVTPLGYILGAQSSSTIHSNFGQRGIAILGPLFQTIAGIAIATHPPFIPLLLAFGVMATGAGWLDGSWSAHVAGMKNANVRSGFLHGGYSIGAAVGPAIAGLAMEKGGMAWWVWYYILVC